MKVVFVENVPGVGKVGDVKEVVNGHARNYLLPKGFAVAATKEELKRVESRKRAEAKKREEQMAEVKGIAGVIDGVSLVFAKKVTSKGNIYGSVSNVAIQQELKQLGHHVEKSMIKLEEPLRQLGEHEVEIELTGDTIARIKVTIEPVEGEATEEKTVEAAAEEVIEEQPEETPEEMVAGEQPEETPEEMVAEEQPEETPEEMVAEEQTEEVPEEAIEKTIEEQPEEAPEETVLEEQSEETTAEDD